MAGGWHLWADCWVGANLRVMLDAFTGTTHAAKHTDAVFLQIGACHQAVARLAAVPYRAPGGWERGGWVHGFRLTAGKPLALARRLHVSNPHTSMGAWYTTPGALGRLAKQHCKWLLPGQLRDLVSP